MQYIRWIMKEDLLLERDSETPTDRTPAWSLWTRTCFKRTIRGGATAGAGPPTRTSGRSSIRVTSTLRRLMKRGIVGAMSSSSTNADSPVTELSSIGRLKRVRLASTQASVAAATDCFSVLFGSIFPGLKFMRCSIRSRSGGTVTDILLPSLSPTDTSRQPRLLDANFDCEFQWITKSYFIFFFFSFFFKYLTSFFQSNFCWRGESSLLINSFEEKIKSIELPEFQFNQEQMRAIRMLRNVCCRDDNQITSWKCFTEKIKQPFVQTLKPK